MSLLKAGFTSRRKTKLLSLLLLIVSIPLYSAEFRVGYYSESEYGMTILDEILSSFGNTADSSYALGSVAERIKLEEERAYLKTLDQAYQNEKDISAVKRPEEELVALPLDIVLAELKPKDAEKQYLSSGSAEAAAYYRLKEKLDLLIVISVEKLDGIDFISLFINGELIRESLYLSSLEESEQMAMIRTLMPYFCNADSGLYKLSYPDGASVSVDGTKINLRTPFIVRGKGSHSFYVSAPYHESELIEIVLGDDMDVNLELKKDAAASLFIRPTPYSAVLNYQGSHIQSHFVSESLSPFSLTAAYPGFSLYSFETTKPLSSLSFTMKPEWMVGENILENEKSKFYASLFSTLITFGASVGAGTLQRIYNEHNFGPFDVVFTGASLVSLVWMVDSMFSYFDAVRYGL